MRVGLDLGHARHIAVTFGKQRQQRLIDAVDLAAHVVLGDAIGGSSWHGEHSQSRTGSSAGLHVILAIFNLASRRKPGHFGDCGENAVPGENSFMSRFAAMTVAGVLAMTSAGLAQEVSVEFGKHVSIIGGCHDCHTVGYNESGGQVDPNKAPDGFARGLRGPVGQDVREEPSAHRLENERRRLADLLGHLQGRARRCPGTTSTR